MKFLVVLIVIVFIAWTLRKQRLAANDAAAPPRRGSRPPLQPQEMVACPVCGVHLPRTEALPAPDGRLYCCDDHRARARR